MKTTSEKGNFFHLQASNYAFIAVCYVIISYIFSTSKNAPGVSGVFREKIKGDGPKSYERRKKYKRKVFLMTMVDLMSKMTAVYCFFCAYCMVNY